MPRLDRLAHPLYRMRRLVCMPAPCLARPSFCVARTYAQGMLAPERIQETAELRVGAAFHARIAAHSVPSFPRWKAIAPSVAMHLCIGAPYAWSVFNGALTRQLGVVAPVADDWTLGQVIPVLSVAFLVHGVGAALLGKRMEKVARWWRVQLSRLTRRCS